MGRHKADATHDQETAVQEAARRIHVLGLREGVCESLLSPGEISFEPRHLRWLLSEPGHELWGPRVKDAPRDLAQRLGRSDDPATIIRRFERIRERVLERWDGESPFPEDADRTDLQGRINALEEAGVLRKVEDGYVYVPCVRDRESPVRAHAKSPTRVIESIMKEEDRPRILDPGSAVGASIAYGVPPGLTWKQKNALEEAAEHLEKARRLVEDSLGDTDMNHFVLAVWGCKPETANTIKGPSGKETDVRIYPDLSLG